MASMSALGGTLLAVACSAPYAEDTHSEQADSAKKRATSGNEPAPSPSPPPSPPGALPVAAGTPLPAKGPGAGGGADAGEGGADAAAADPLRCPGKSPVAVATWKAPPPAASVCSSSDITYFASVAANQTWLGIESLMTTRNANCSKCIFSHDVDASWRPVVYVGANGDALVNYAACFARAAGGSDACGRAYYQWADCYAQVCDAKACGTDAAVTACYQTQGAADACAAYSPATPCGGAGAYASLNNVCGSYTDVARVVCSH